MTEEVMLSMMNSVKITLRKRGKEELDKLIRSDHSHRRISNRRWWDIIFGCLQWENKELQHCQKKHPTSSHILFPNVSNFWLVCY